MIRDRSWLGTTGLTRRQVSRTMKSPPLLLPPLLFPLLLFGAFAGGLSTFSSSPAFVYPNYTTFQFCWVLLTGVALAGMATGLALAQDFETGFSRRILLATSHRWPIVSGYVLSGLTRAVFVGALLLAVGLAAQMEVSGSPVELLAVIALAVGFNIAVTLWSVGVALRIRSLQAGPLIQTPVFIALFLVPVYVPRDLLSGWVHTAADGNPLTRVVEASRGLIIGEPVQVALAFGLIAALIAVMAVWALTGLRSAQTLAGAGRARRRRVAWRRRAEA
jgi:ABC-2 type transport system permease protein